MPAALILQQKNNIVQGVFDVVVLVSKNLIMSYVCIAWWLGNCSPIHNTKQKHLTLARLKKPVKQSRKTFFIRNNLRGKAWDLMIIILYHTLCNDFCNYPILSTAVLGISQVCNFIQAVRKFQELTRVHKKKKLKEEKLLYIFLPKALNSGLTPFLSILLHLSVVHWKYSYMYTYIWGFLGFFLSKFIYCYL